MKQVVRIVIGSVVLIMFTNLNAFAAKPKAAPTKKADSAAADNMQCKEVTIAGLFQLIETKDKAGKVTGSHYAIVDSKKKETVVPGAAGINFKEYEGLKVKAVCMQLGPNIISLKSMDAIDKAAHEAKIAELEAAKKAAADAKKAPAAPAKAK